ncbi:hypothetical protein [Aliidiomarina soli]|uniref:Uncharacterized protein n=1 Tax=Aliidiomarina soli TaxID=1928574 RepID=A0A432WLW8_9GAMM|nr:hypothetical protein [Aliidiomarina soli]RUO34810.1 hypothetical protein CWE14_02085 [Aliidiomarina soli]
MRDYLPDSASYFVNQGMYDFYPWRLLNRESQYEYITKGVEPDGSGNGKVYVFAKREDTADFAGLEIVDSKITDRVICFRSLFAEGDSKSSWNIVRAIHDDVFAFIANHVVADMRALVQSSK